MSNAVVSQKSESEICKKPSISLNQKETEMLYYANEPYIVDIVRYALVLKPKLRRHMVRMIHDIITLRNEN